LGEAHLKFGDVVAALIGPREIEKSLSELPPGFNETGPGDGVDLSRDRQTTSTLKGLDGDHGVVAIVVGWVREGSETQCDEAIMEIAHPKAGGAAS
jgi:hypothetical protein